MKKTKKEIKFKLERMTSFGGWVENRIPEKYQGYWKGYRDALCWTLGDESGEQQTYPLPFERLKKEDE